MPQGAQHSSQRDSFQRCASGGSEARRLSVRALQVNPADGCHRSAIARRRASRLRAGKGGARTEGTLTACRRRPDPGRRLPAAGPGSSGDAVRARLNVAAPRAYRESGML